MDADPTMDLIRSLDDPNKWSRQTVIAFVPHEITHPERVLRDGSKVPAQKIKVTEDQLRQEAERANERAARTGRLDTLTIGHRKFDPNFPEKDQPPLVGFCRNYSVQWVQREKGRFLGLVYDEFVAKDKADEFKLYRQFPFRSSEYHPSLGIQGVAALVRPPALDMGTTYIYQAFEGTTVNEQQFNEWFSKAMATYQASQAAAADEAKKKAEPVPAEKKEPVRPPATAAVDVATYAAEVEKLKTQLAAETAARVKSECGKLLDPLKDLVTFVYDRELATLVGMPTEAARLEHVTYMAKHYSKLPGAAGMVHVLPGAAPVADDGSDPTKAPTNHEKVLTYMRSHPGMQYEAAEAAVAAAK